MITIKMGDQSYTDIFETVEWSGSIKTSLDSSFDSLIKNLSNGFEFGGSTI